MYFYETPVTSATLKEYQGVLKEVRKKMKDI